MLRCLVLLATVGLLAGCSKAPTDAGGRPPAPTTREGLIAALVAKGDQLGGTAERWRAVYPYEFALAYSNGDATITQKFETVKSERGKAHFSLEEANRMAEGIRTLPMNPKEWPRLSPDNDLIELRILTDERVVGSVQYAPMSIDDDPNLVAGQPMAFTAIPKVTLDEMRAAYGEPSARKAFPGGSVVASYGRILVITSKDSSTVAMVFFRPDTQVRISRGE